MGSLQWDYILKYVLIGDSSVGKSSLLVRLTDDRFDLTEPTLGVEFGSRILTVGEEGKRIKIQCWDTAGTESFRSITRSYFRGAAGALLVYDVTRRDSFEHVTSWLDDLRRHADENVSIILVANKTDLCSPTPPSLPTASYGQAIPPPSPTTPTSSSQSNFKPRAVTSQEGMLFAKSNNLLYVETSAKEGWNVENAFEWTAREILKRVTEEELARKKGGKGVKLGEAKKAGGCC
ncbi:rab family protein [Cryptococcus deuterogattii 99/473]|uniref:Rab family protein n=2 Tax=Cryptococcus deuterogattii TaxID=1859096 RepID=A0A0D0TQQ3_9TREE|nr:rab family protein [Cryptococcus deuterogattii R265]KIR26258.1 rab family protein [Cryptococcus deuterogattii LA55]KIR31896.1 rab family protein [Cryptococcus deuterogattii MMRL2647]KIR37773.1 rab family protein [Cryptococcus deuterogattii Ram5]KIR70387.1 rab family protein [Cryptococcus deuterogattii CA1014]KIR89687.1 rab family protein [Cryptococcus deuterogattii CBS 10090]KIR96529.1 rab family protein [Cryptococcus deuterogattii 2001/935-1]KIY55404.1 rab family protein [Cryptococcus de